MTEKSSKTENLVPRSPVIAVMGHIDHGKSKLLDFIRKTNVVDSEAGGITQKMSAYEVDHKGGEGKIEKITFLDTPGHEAFKTIRARGAEVADIAILIVAADDGVKPQTLEALKCIREAKLPFIVAINKIDKPEADIEKTRNSLMENEVYLEGHGGDVPFAEISAKHGNNVPDLLELIGLVAEMEDLKGNPNEPAEGVVLESSLEPKKGIAATLVIKNGSLKNGLFVVAENAIAPIRIMENFKGEKITEATFSSPVQIIGWNCVPKVGAIFKTYKTKKEAEKAACEFKNETCQKEPDQTDNEDESEKVIIPIIIKADTEGSIEAIEHEVEKLKSEKIDFKILNYGIGMISENDIKKANVDKQPIIIGFNTKIDNSAKTLAERDGITIKTFDIIYKITEWLKNDLSNLLPKVEVEEILGKSKIIRIFGDQKGKQVIGGKVTEGVMQTGEPFRILRKENIIGTGKVRGLQQQKSEVKEVKEENEFGAMVESKIPVSEGDVLEFFKVTKQPVKI